MILRACYRPMSDTFPRACRQLWDSNPMDVQITGLRPTSAVAGPDITRSGCWRQRWRTDAGMFIICSFRPSAGRCRDQTRRMASDSSVDC